MRGDLDAFVLLGRCLAVDQSTPAVSVLRRDLLRPGNDWLRFAELANRDRVTPTVWTSLRRKGCDDALPPDLQAYLDEIHRRNGQRNAAIRHQAAEVIAALNERCIVPMVLKGGLQLFEPGFDATARIMADVDLLVGHADFLGGIEALKSLGYVALDGSDVNPTHSCTLFRAGELATIDLHRDLGPQRRLLAPDEAWTAALPLQADGIRLMTLSPTHRVLHNIVNSAINGPNYRMGAVRLRQLHDFALLAQRHAAAIDWRAIRGHLADGGLEHTLNGLLCLANRLLDLPLPTGTRKTLRSRLYVQRHLLQIRSAPVRSGMRFWARIVHALDRVRMDYLYDCGPGAVRLNAARLHHLRVLCLQRGSFILKTIARDLRAL